MRRLYGPKTEFWQVEDGSAHHDGWNNRSWGWEFSRVLLVRVSRNSMRTPFLLQGDAF